MPTTSVKTLEAHQQKINQLEALNKEKDNLLNEALGEINALRNQNYQQSLRLTMFDDLKLLLHTSTGNNRDLAGKSIDVAYQIQRHLNEWKP